MNKTTIIIIVIVILLLGGIFVTKTFTEKVVNENVKEFTVKAFKFGYSPDTITVNKGDKVRIIIDNTDVLHGIRIPDLGIKNNDVLEFTADKTGEFDWYCTNMCGEGHMQMKGRLIVK